MGLSHFPQRQTFLLRLNFILEFSKQFHLPDIKGLAWIDRMQNWAVLLIPT